MSEPTRAPWPPSLLHRFLLAGINPDDVHEASWDGATLTVLLKADLRKVVVHAVIE